MNEGAPAPSSDRQGYVLNRPREDCRHTSALASIDGAIGHPGVKGRFRELLLNLVAEPDTCAYQGIVVAVAHRQYKEKTATGEIAKDLGARNGCIVYDLKSVLPRDGSDLRL